MSMSNKNTGTEISGYESTNPLFRSLSAEEVSEFRQHAKDHYVIGSEISDLWHPAYRQACEEINAEAKQKLVDRWNNQPDS